MSQILTSLIERVRADYQALMEKEEGRFPYTTAEQLCNEKLYLNADQLAGIIAEDPTLLAARAGNLIASEKEKLNPSVGMIISANIATAMMEGLVELALEKGWLSLDAEGRLMLDADELKLPEPQAAEVDYSESETAKENLTQPGASILSQLMATAEAAYSALLNTEQQDAYGLALQVASEHSLFAPDDIAPLVAENPLLLGMRGDNMMDQEMFEGDPPAGMVISAHLTQMIVSQLLELAVEQGAIGTDSSGHPLIPEVSDNSVLH
ncbi:hypothetical protein [Amphritea balenae]|uniref:Uncharacterized protein n=1 Tax=Amphritea balenae TaxID=452629 RepID=A0A3P1STM0_9GAMM|nr:hypothetical protein [Amphritea balenae]RRD00388.1 hypothetical protein EHS89_04650 [Amphritea balenae]GGK85869.1 hypothetical protein GCM10007941_40440 [Amphritea balenae]